MELIIWEHVKTLFCLQSFIPYSVNLGGFNFEQLCSVGTSTKRSLVSSKET